MSGLGASSAGSSMQLKYRGVRPRKWGKWVTEVREPGPRKRRIWLGSFRSAEEAARAYDAGLLCVGGSPSKLNFPDERPTLPPGTPGNYTIREVQGAAQMAAAASVGRRFSFSDWMRSQSPTQDSDPEDTAVLPTHPGSYPGTPYSYSNPGDHDTPDPPSAGGIWDYSDCNDY